MADYGTKPYGPELIQGNLASFYLPFLHQASSECSSIPFG